jgi:hypothetical protein
MLFPIVPMTLLSSCSASRIQAIVRSRSAIHGDEWVALANGLHDREQMSEDAIVQQHLRRGRARQSRAGPQPSAPPQAKDRA